MFVMVSVKRFIVILPLLLLSFVGCEQEDTLLSERDKIEKYLTSSRNMVAEEDMGSVIEDNPSFYNLFDRYAYRHIVNYYEEGRDERTTVAWGDELELRFNAYVFTGSEPSLSSLYWTNVEEVILSLQQQSDSKLEWSSEPLKVRLGETDMLKGLEHTLPGCRERDSVQVFMTSNLAYGKKLLGSVPKNSMIAWYMRIEKVTK